MTGRDIWECANQLGGYVGPNTPDDLAEFLTRESDAAADLARSIEILRTREREAQDRYKATEDELRATEAKLARVERRNVELEEALKPFAAAPYSGANAFNRAALSDDDFRAARRALQSQETDDGR